MKVGIIGLGVGEKHIAGYETIPGCEVVCLCDFNEEKLRDVAGRHPGKATTRDPNAVLNDPAIDVVSIASYDNYHCEQILRAIRNNKHVFVEKPLCLSESEAREIRMELNRMPHIRLSSNLILRMCPRFRRLRSLIRNGELGDIFSIEGDYNYGRLHKITEGWRGQIDFYSVVYGGGIHLVDLMLWLTGKKVIEVSAVGNQISSQGTQYRYNDCVAALLRFEDGMIAKVTSNYGCVYPHFHKLSVYGTEASFENHIESGFLYTSRDPGRPPLRIDEPYPGYQKGDLIASFVKAIQSDGRPEVGIEDVFAAMSVCLSIEEASKNFRTLAVKYI